MLSRPIRTRMGSGVSQLTDSFSSFQNWKKFEEVKTCSDDCNKSVSQLVELIWRIFLFVSYCIWYHTVFGRYLNQILINIVNETIICLLLIKYPAILNNCKRSALPRLIYKDPREYTIIFFLSFFLLSFLFVQFMCVCTFSYRVYYNLLSFFLLSFLFVQFMCTFSHRCAKESFRQNRSRVTRAW